MFFILQGTLRIEMETGTVELSDSLAEQLLGSRTNVLSHTHDAVRH